MDYHCRSAEKTARFLVGHPKVRDVFFPGLEGHPGHQTAKAQMAGFGGMVSFRLSGGAACRKFMDRLRLSKIGVSLGDAATLMLHPASVFHPGVSDTACRRLGTDPALIRVSTGLEDPEDILEDIKSALRAV